MENFICNKICLKERLMLRFKSVFFVLVTLVYWGITEFYKSLFLINCLISSFNSNVAPSIISVTFGFVHLCPVCTSVGTRSFTSVLVWWPFMGPKFVDTESVESIPNAEIFDTWMFDTMEMFSEVDHIEFFFANRCNKFHSILKSEPLLLNILDAYIYFSSDVPRDVSCSNSPYMGGGRGALAQEDRVSVTGSIRGVSVSNFRFKAYAPRAFDFFRKIYKVELTDFMVKE